MTDCPMLPPGSTEAYALGCNCQPRDGEAGYVNPAWPDWITERCPLHGPDTVRNDEGGA